MVKELERQGIPAVLICTLTSIAETVGANRIVQALGIPHPLGDPRLSREEERIVRKRVVRKALGKLAQP